MDNANKDKAIAYCSVGTAIDDDEPSIGEQKRLISKFAENNNLDILAWAKQIGITTGRSSSIALQKAYEYCLDTNQLRGGSKLKDTDRIKYIIAPYPQVFGSIVEYYYWESTFSHSGVELIFADDDIRFIDMHTEEQNYRWYAALSPEEKAKEEEDYPGLGNDLGKNLDSMAVNIEFCVVDTSGPFSD